MNTTGTPEPPVPSKIPDEWCHHPGEGPAYAAGWRDGYLACQALQAAKANHPSACAPSPSRLDEEWESHHRDIGGGWCHCGRRLVSCFRDR